MAPIRTPLMIAALLLLAAPLHAADPPYQPTPADTAALQQALALDMNTPPAAMNAVVSLRDDPPAWPAPLNAQGLL